MESQAAAVGLTHRKQSQSSALALGQRIGWRVYSPVKRAAPSVGGFAEGHANT